MNDEVIFVSELFPSLERIERTPQTEAEDIFSKLVEIYVERYPERCGDGYREIVERTIECGGVRSRGEVIAERYGLYRCQDDFPGAPAEVLSDQFAEVALGFVIDAIRAASTEKDLAWTYVIDATEAAAAAIFFLQEYLEQSHVQDQRATHSLKMNDERHAENRDMRQMAADWYRSHRGNGMTKEAAAQAIAGKVVPAKYRTVRAWLTKVRD